MLFKGMLCTNNGFRALVFLAGMSCCFTSHAGDVIRSAILYIGPGNANYENVSEELDFAGLETELATVFPGYTFGLVEKTDSGFGYRVGFGVGLFDNFAITFGKVDLGKYEFDFLITDVSGTSVLDGRIDATGVELALHYAIPVSNFLKPTLKYGLFSWTVDLRYTLPDETKLKFSESDSDSTYGVGLDFIINDFSTVSLNWDMYNVDTVEIDMLTLNYKFQPN